MVIETAEVVDSTPVEKMSNAAVVEEAQRISRAAEPAPTALVRGSLSTDQFIQTAIERGSEVATLRELLAIRREERADVAREAFAQAMVSFRTQIQPIIKTGKRDDTKIKSRKTGEFGTVKYTYAELGTTDDQIRPLLAQCQLVPTYRTLRDEPGWISVECIVTHVLGHKESSGPLGAPPSNNERLTPVQQRMASLTSLKRMALFQVFGLVTKDQIDLDGNTGKTDDEKPPAPTITGTDKDRWAFLALCSEKVGAKIPKPQALVWLAETAEFAKLGTVQECLDWLRDYGSIKDGHICNKDDKEGCSDK